jgi:RNA polymerase sigma-70 factor (ECF subfamily)
MQTHAKKSRPKRREHRCGLLFVGILGPTLSRPAYLRFFSAITGKQMPKDTPASVKVNDAKMMINDMNERLGEDLPTAYGPEGVDLGHTIDYLKTELDNARKSANELEGLLDNLQEEYEIYVQNIQTKQEELMQEIWLALWRALPTFRGDSSLRTWMYRVAHNVAVTHVHRAKRQPATSPDLGVEVAGAGITPDATVEGTRRLEQLRAAIRELKPIDRQIILLYLEQIPQAEIAEITGLSTTNVATRVGRIKAELTRALSPGSK